MVNLGEAVLNDVTTNKPKMLLGLNQKVGGQVQGLQSSLAQMTHHRRRAATLPTQAHRRNVVSPSPSPQGKATRKSSPLGGG